MKKDANYKLMPDLVLIWHRRDLRLHDNALYASLCASSFISCTNNNITKSSIPPTLSLYVFDPSDFMLQPSIVVPECWDTVRVGPHASRVLLEAVTSMREELRRIGSELIVRSGVDPSVAIPMLVEEISEKMGQVSLDGTFPSIEVRWSEFPGYDEVRVSQRVRQALNDLNQRMCDTIQIKTECVCTLYHPDDLPRDSRAWMKAAYPKQKFKYKKGRETRTSKLSTKLENEYRFNDCIDVSQDRFQGMVKVMGDWRRSVRTHAVVRDMVSTPYKLVRPGIMINEGVIPSHQDLLEPIENLLDTYQENIKKFEEDKVNEYSGRRSLLGLDPEMLTALLTQARVCANSITFNVNHTSENQALRRMYYFISPSIASNAVRNTACTEGDASSHFSTHLAFGTLSPRAVYFACIKSEDKEGCKWLISHMEMRDYFLFRAWAEGIKLFSREKHTLTTKQSERNKKASLPSWKSPKDSSQAQLYWRAWVTGQTGLPLVDAAMTELRLVGFCSNRVRQNCASVLTKDLNIDWRAGAELFQFLLDDHEVGANWGNWRYFSGVGHDPKERHFRTISQAVRYDPSCSYVRKWVQSLQNVKQNEAVLRPWAHSHVVNFSNGSAFGGWKYPIVDPESQLTWNDLKKLEEKNVLLELEPDKN